MNHAPTCAIAIKTAEVSGVMECNTMHPWLPTQLLDGPLDDACTSSHLVERQNRPPYRSIGSMGVFVCVTVVRGVCAAQESDAAKPGPSATFANTGRWPGLWGMPADLLLEAHPGHLCLSVSVTVGAHRAWVIFTLTIPFLTKWGVDYVWGYPG